MELLSRKWIIGCGLNDMKNRRIQELAKVTLKGEPVALGIISGVQPEKGRRKSNFLLGWPNDRNNGWPLSGGRNPTTGHSIASSEVLSKKKILPLRSAHHPPALGRNNRRPAPGFLL